MISLPCVVYLTRYYVKLLATVFLFSTRSSHSHLWPTSFPDLWNVALFQAQVWLRALLPHGVLLFCSAHPFSLDDWASGRSWACSTADSHNRLGLPWVMKVTGSFHSFKYWSLVRTSCNLGFQCSWFLSEDYWTWIFYKGGIRRENYLFISIDIASWYKCNITCHYPLVICRCYWKCHSVVCDSLLEAWSSCWWRFLPPTLPPSIALVMQHCGTDGILPVSRGALERGLCLGLNPEDSSNLWLVFLWLPQAGIREVLAFIMGKLH